MPMKETFTLENAKEIIDYALSNFYSHDKALVQYSNIKAAVSENCMLFRIGWYMHEYVQTNCDLAELSVDCQYNRNFKHPKSMYKPTLSGIYKKVKDPVPDLLFHQRGSNDNNFFLVELKKGKPDKAELLNDDEKLRYFTDQLSEYKYSYVFSIWLYKKAWVQVKVYTDGKERSHLNYVWRAKSTN